MSVDALLLRLEGRDGPFDAAALYRNGRLEDLRLSPAAARGDEPWPGAIYAARILRRLPGGAGALLDLGGPRAFLADPGDRAEGDAALVEILRPAESRKAAQASARIEFSGPFLTHTPLAPGVNLSRKLRDPVVRNALSAILAPFSDRGGWIVRTAAAEATPEALRAEAERLADQAAGLSAAPLSPPRRLRAAPDPAALAERAWGGAPADLRDEGAAAPQAERLRDDLDALTASVVPLKGGGRLTLQRLEALVAIDVDASDSVRTAVNQAAARAIPRQLRLRGWGGMVLIDFAGRDADERPRLEQALAAALRAEPGGASWRVAGWGPLGLLEAAAKRDRAPLERFWPVV